MTPNRLSSRQAATPELGSALPVFNAIARFAGLLITLSLLFMASALADDQLVPPDVLAARVTTTPDRARLILDLSQTTKFAVVSLVSPDRIAVDVQAGAVKFDSASSTAGTGLVAGYTVTMVGPGRARAMLILAQPVQVQQAYVLDKFADQPARLVVDLIPDTPEDFAKRAASDAAAQPGQPAATPLADNSTPPGGSNANAGAAATVVGAPAIGAAQSIVNPAAPTATAAAPEKAKPLIVLDPGHGGIDSGARAPNGIMEKNIVLAFALKLQALLVKSGRFDVALTRTDDTYLTLEQRVELGRQNKADLFISLHADTFGQPQIHGTSIYTRDEQATDVLDKVLADKENKFDVVSGFAVPKMTPATVDVLLDLMRRQMRKQSYMAAQSIIGELQPSVELRRFPVRQADFFVLQAPDVPSMLIELGFMSNSDDIANLTDPAWQDRVADALARGIAAYFDQTAKP
jgi:N-acetylmuramoyl-L-alanine amidase